jgi:hypothetical protein
MLVYFQPSETARGIAVRHLNDVIKPNELFTPRVMEPILEEINEKVIKPTFCYGVDEEFIEEIDHLIDEDEKTTEE